MPIEPHEFLTQSQLLIKTPDEVDHRSAVSRAYYAALHGAITVCKRVLGGLNLTTGANTHQKVIGKLQDSSRDSSYSPALRTQLGAVSIQLIKGRKLRVRADYGVSGPNRRFTAVVIANNQGVTRNTLKNRMLRYDKSQPESGERSTHPRWFAVPMES